MKIGIESAKYLRRYGVEAGAETMRRHGFEAMDYSDLCNTETALWALPEKEFEQTLTAQRRVIEAAGIEIYQAHGPWRFPMRDFTTADRAERFEKMAKAVRGCAVLGCPHMVIHNMMPYGAADISKQVVWDINADFMTRLADVGREYGVTVCMENMPFTHQHLATPAALFDFIKALDHPYLRMCLDTGHAAVFPNGTTPADAARMWGTDYLRTLHVHDNNGKHDNHWTPGTEGGVIDWADFTKALLEIGYQGVLSLECGIYESDPAVQEQKEIALAQTALQLAGRA